MQASNFSSGITHGALAFTETRNARFAEVPAQLIGKLGGESADPWAAVVKHVQEIVDHAESMEELQASLLQAYDGLPLEDLRKVMAQGFQVAVLAGMADVKNKSGGGG